MRSEANFSSSYLQSLFSSALQDADLEDHQISTAVHIGVDASVAPRSNNDGPSLVHLMRTLQHLRDSDPPKYQRIIRQIAKNLQDATQAIQTPGEPVCFSVTLEHTVPDETSSSLSTH